jgi:hypothetical protein
MEQLGPYFASLIVLEFLGLGICIVCIVLAWKSIWGRVRHSRSASDNGSGIVEMLLGVAETASPKKKGVGEAPESQTASQNQITSSIDPEEALKLLIRTRQVASISFLVFGAFVFMCSVVLIGVAFDRASVLQKNKPATDSASKKVGQNDGARADDDSRIFPSPTAAPTLKPSPTPPQAVR